MSTSGHGEAPPESGTWRLELTPCLYSNAESLTAAIDGLFEQVDERLEDCSVRLWFDTSAHHQQAVDLLGLIASASTNSQDVEAQEIIRLQAQVEKLLKLVKERLRWAKKKGRKGLSSLQKALLNPLNNLRKKLRNLLLATRSPASPWPATNELPDFHTTWLARQKTKARLHALYGEWDLLRPTVPPAKPLSAWHRALGRLWVLPGLKKAPPAKRAKLIQPPEIYNLLSCFRVPFSEEVEELSHTVDVCTFLGGRVLGLCRTLAESNTRPPALVLTRRWRELLEISRELHIDSGCLRFAFLSPFAESDPRNDGGQELIESTRVALISLLDQALGIRPDHLGGLIRSSVQLEAPPAPNHNKRKFPEQSLSAPNSPTPLNRDGVPSALQTVSAATNEGAVQASKRPPQGSATGTGPAEARDALNPEVTVNLLAPEAAPASLEASASAAKQSKAHSLAIKITITKEQNGFKVIHVKADGGEDMIKKPSVADGMMALLVLKGSSADRSGGGQPTITVEYQEFFDLCYPVSTQQTRHEKLSRPVRRRIRALREYLSGIEIEDAGTTFTVKNLDLVHTYKVNIQDVALHLRTKSGRVNTAD